MGEEKFASLNLLSQMKTILYVHGFGSSGASGTVLMLRQMLYPHGVKVIAPDLPVKPLEAITLLQDLVEKENPDLIIGTSMGGFYTELLKGRKRILVNPSFKMARLLTFRGMGRYPFLNKREDGVKEFKVDKEMIDQFKTLEKESFSKITPEEKENVYAFFGNADKITQEFQPIFCKHYGKEHFAIFDGEHRLNDAILNKVVLPLMKSLLAIDE